MPSRLWLGTADSNGATKLHHDTKISNRHQNAAIPPVPALPVSPPVIPPRHSPALTSSSHDSRSRSGHTKPPRPKTFRRDVSDRTTAHDSTGPPEVISNLIDSLATISFPDPTIDQGSSPRPPTTNQYPDSPRHALAAASPHALRHSRSFDGGEYAALRSALSEQFAGIDDAAESPVIRTTKSPSSWGQSSSNRLSKNHNMGNGGLGISNGLDSPTTYSARRNGSLHSIASVEGGRYSPSKLRTRRRSSLISPSSETFDSTISPTRRSFKWTPHGSVKQNTARPVANQDPVIERRFDALEQPVQENKSSPKVTSSRLDSSRLENTTYPSLVQTLPLVSNREGKKPAKSPNVSPAIVQGPAVPNRRSSLRPQEFPELDLPLEDLAPITFPSKGNSSKQIVDDMIIPACKDEPKTLTSLDMLSGDDTEVTKRIKELKAKKEQRDKEAKDSPSPDVQVSLLANGNTVKGGSTKPDRRRKTLADVRLPHIPKRTHHTTQNESEERPTTPLTPTHLPINYSFVVQSLSEEHCPVSRSEPYLDPPPARPPSRPQSVGAIMKSGPPKTSIVKSFWNRRDPARRAATPDYVDGRPSYDSQSCDTKVTTRRSTSVTSRRKRWSQSDLNDSRVAGATREAVRETVYEERPSSQDNIGRAVDNFIHAQRLSQKIRHPGTGRVISFSEVGNPKGNVVFCCVGMGLTRFVTAFYDELANTLNLRLITPDRPGVGNSELDQNGTPLSWPDDVLLICNALNVHKFSILAHSAGAIYALATALRVPQHIRGKVHLLAPWIPPSQMETIGTHHDPPPPGAQLPTSQRFLRILPAPLLRVANSSFLSATSASLSPNLGGAPAKSKKKKSSNRSNSPNKSFEQPRPVHNRPQHTRRESIMLMDQQSMPRTSHGASATLDGHPAGNSFMSDGQAPPLPAFSQHLNSLQHNGAQSRSFSAPLSPINDAYSELGSPLANDPDLRRLYDERLTLAIWTAATTAANPAVDLLVCLERSHSIGFRYVDITRSVVIHHGAKDSRVPVDNVKWLGGMMRRCEVRVLEGESHGLMASATVMGSVLTEMAHEWQEWDKMVKKGRAAN